MCGLRQRGHIAAIGKSLSMWKLRLVVRIPVENASPVSRQEIITVRIVLVPSTCAMPHTPVVRDRESGAEVRRLSLENAMSKKAVATAHVGASRLNVATVARACREGGRGGASHAELSAAMIAWGVPYGTGRIRRPFNLTSAARSSRHAGARLRRLSDTELQCVVDLGAWKGNGRPAPSAVTPSQLKLCSVQARPSEIR